MSADFQADRRSPCTNDMVKKAESGCARAAEQVFRTLEMMSSGPVAESEPSIKITFSTFSGTTYTGSKSKDWAGASKNDR